MLLKIYNLCHFKIFISFFFRQPKKKKTIKIAAGSSDNQTRARHVPETVEHEEEVITLEDGEEEDVMLDSAAEEEAMVTDGAVVDDSGKAEHDEAVV